MREKSSSVLTSFRSRRLLRWATSRRPRCTSFKADDDVSSSASSIGPSMSVSGVRNSWLTLEKNRVLARSISANAAPRADARDKEAGRLFQSGAGNRSDDGALDRLRPGRARGREAGRRREAEDDFGATALC